MKRFQPVLIHLLLCCSSVIFMGWPPHIEAGPRDGALSPSESAFAEMAAAGDARLSQPNATKTISAQELWSEMNDADTTQPYIISVRHFLDDSTRGHIPGAVHWEYTSLTDSTLHHLLPAHKKIVVYCYAGQTLSFAAGYLNMMGFDAYNLKWGMSGWTTDTSVVGAGGAWYALTRTPQAIESAAHEWATQYPFPEPNCLASGLNAMITERCDAYFKAGYKSKIASWSMVNQANLDADSSNDYFIVSYMPRNQYNAGHISGSYCMEPGRLGINEDLRYLPPNRPILIVCSDGHISGSVCLYLRMLGYDAWSLRFGNNAVTDDIAILGVDNVWIPPQSLSYPVEKGVIERH